MFVSKMLFLLGGVVPATGICTIVYSSSKATEAEETVTGEESSGETSDKGTTEQGTKDTSTNDSI